MPKTDAIGELVSRAVAEAAPKAPPDERAEVEAALKPIEDELSALRERLKAAQGDVEGARSVEERVKCGIEAEALRQLIERAEVRAAPLRRRLGEIAAAERKAALEAELRGVQSEMQALQEQAKALVGDLERAFAIFAEGWHPLDSRYRTLERREHELEQTLGVLMPGAVAVTNGLRPALFAFGERLRIAHGGGTLAEIVAQYGKS